MAMTRKGRRLNKEKVGHGLKPGDEIPLELSRDIILKLEAVMDAMAECKKSIIASSLEPNAVLSILGAVNASSEKSEGNPSVLVYFSRFRDMMQSAKEFYDNSDDPEGRE